MKKLINNFLFYTVIIPMWGYYILVGGLLLFAATGFTGSFGEVNALQVIGYIISIIGIIGFIAFMIIITFFEKF